jgi:hypothetical protein
LEILDCELKAMKAMKMCDIKKSDEDVRHEDADEDQHEDAAGDGDEDVRHEGADGDQHDDAAGEAGVHGDEDVRHEDADGDQHEDAAGDEDVRHEDADGDQHEDAAGDEDVRHEDAVGDQHEDAAGEAGGQHNDADGEAVGEAGGQLNVGDIVFDEEVRLWPLRVYRIGFGNYEGQVRVAQLHEDPNIFENGSWISASRCLKLEISDFLEVRCRGLFEALNNRPTELEIGTKCKFLGFDGDGDVRLKIGSRCTIIFFRDLIYMTIM